MSTKQEIRESLIGALKGLGYYNDLLVRDFGFRDWFADSNTERIAAAVGFADTPVSPDSACIGLVEANGVAGRSLVDCYRAIGAPVILEIDRDVFREWMVSRRPSEHRFIGEYSKSDISTVFHRRANDWTPEELYRAKNIGHFSWAPDFNLFSGLLPELEEHIHAELDPLLRSALSATHRAYEVETGKDPNPEKLFKLIFWLLTAKVFHDRQVPGFKLLGKSSDPDEILRAVAKQYRVTTPRLLTRRCRETAAFNIWTKLDFRNISVDVLSQIWSTTLVDDAVKESLGIHRTPKAVVDYIVKSIPFHRRSNDQLIVLEPCCGSGAFLVGAMHELRKQLFSHTPRQRHHFFRRTLVGLEKDPFGAEIGRFALTLADFPNPDGWDIRPTDVFDDPNVSQLLQRAAVVLCNPPFRDFSAEERQHYGAHSPKRPVELLNRILDNLHPDGVIGFVLPRLFASGKGGYEELRHRLAQRFSNIDVVALPDRAFDASTESCLVIATNPIAFGPTHLTVSKVKGTDAAWNEFQRAHSVTCKSTKVVTADDLKHGIQMPDLAELWEYLEPNPKIGSVANIHRGIEWHSALTAKGRNETGNRDILESNTPREGFRQGVPSKSKFGQYTKPLVKYLDMRPDSQRTNAYKHPWDKEKVILNKSARSRGNWRMSAFPDMRGLACYQTFIGMWSMDETYDPIVLSAIINSPLANAFVVSWEGKTDVRVDTVRMIPVPYMNESLSQRIHDRVKSFTELLHRDDASEDHLRHKLASIDAAVLEAYDLPPKLEHELLQQFDCEHRPTSFEFYGYGIEGDDEAYFTLRERLTDGFEESTIEHAIAQYDLGDAG